jgi:hypothetical protein
MPSEQGRVLRARTDRGEAILNLKASYQVSLLLRIHDGKRPAIHRPSGGSGCDTILTTGGTYAHREQKSGVIVKQYNDLPADFNRPTRASLPARHTNATCAGRPAMLLLRSLETGQWRKAPPCLGSQ